MRKFIRMMVTAFLLAASLSFTVMATEVSPSITTTMTDANYIHPEWLQQKIIFTWNDTTWVYEIASLANTQVIIHDPAGSRSCQLTDITTVDAFLAGINAQLAAEITEMPDAAGVMQQTYYQLNEAFEPWLIDALQDRLIQGSGIGVITVDLAEDHLVQLTVVPQVQEEPETATQEERPIAGFEEYVLVGGCVTDYRTSSSNRCTNIQVAAERLNNMVVEPGQSVSVSTAILPRTTANGYKTAGAYEGGKTVPAIGGGICQVSSTVYNAVMNAGLTVTQRYPHSMTVSYLPIGLDAAISAGSKDLVFKNDYDTPILITTETKDKKLTVNVYVHANTLAGRSYKFWSEKTGSLSAVSYLTYYQDGVETQTVKVAKSRYMPHS